MLEGLNRGAKVDLHLSLYEDEVAILDALCVRHDCSRAAAVGALLKRYAGTEIEAPRAQPGRRARRKRERKA